MHTNVTQYIPMLSSQAGSCLTAENWQAVGIKTVAYYLSSLLMKPGFDALNTLPDLATYVGWQTGLVLNASMPDLNASGEYVLRSSYDGSRSRYTPAQLLTLIAQLKPQFVILPRGVHRANKTAWQALPATIYPFFPINDQPEEAGTRQYGVYCQYDETTATPEILQQQLAPYKGRPIYVSGTMSQALLQTLTALGVQYIESDSPAHDASQGILYTRDGDMAIQNATHATQFAPIDTDCNCPPCKQQLTRAYVHHLFEHTPLLCQRLLIQHNAHNFIYKL